MSDQNVSRRNFMVRAIIGIGAFIGAAIAVPLAGFGILPVLRKKEPDWSDAGTSVDLAVNEPQERRLLSDRQDRMAGGEGRTHRLAREKAGREREGILPQLPSSRCAATAGSARTNSSNAPAMRASSILTER